MSSYDKLEARLDGLTDTVQTKETTIRTLPLFGIEGGSEIWILKTVRQKEVGDHIFVDYVGPDNKALRLVLPPKVADAIARQRDALTSKNRSRAAKEKMEQRMADGYKPKPPRRRRKHGKS